MLGTRELIKTTPDKQLLAITISIRVLKSIRLYVNDYACFIRPKDSIEKGMDRVVFFIGPLT